MSTEISCLPVQENKMSCVALFCGDKRLRVSIASGGGCISFYLLGGRLRGLNATHASPFEGRGGSFSESRHTDTPHRYATHTTHSVGFFGCVRVGSMGSVAFFGSIGFRYIGAAPVGTPRFTTHDCQGLFFSHPHQHNTPTHTTRVWWCVPREHRCFTTQFRCSSTFSRRGFILTSASSRIVRRV